MLLWRIAVASLIGLLSYSTFTAESNKLLRYEIREIRTHKAKAVTVTWYTSTVEECDDTPFITADGTRVKHGIIAISPDLLNTFSYGDSLYVDGFGWFTVHDRMNNRWKNRVDIWTDSRNKAIRNGIQQREIRWDYETDTEIVIKGE